MVDDGTKSNQTHDGSILYRHIVIHHQHCLFDASSSPVLYLSITIPNMVLSETGFWVLGASLMMCCWLLVLGCRIYDDNILVSRLT